MARRDVRVRGTRGGRIVRGLWALGELAGCVLLWFPISSAAEPRLVKDIDSRPETSQPYWFVPVGNRVFFVADDGEHGQELWVSDGTEAGTRLVKDIVPGLPESVDPSPGFFAVPFAGERIFFRASDSEHGQELWITDGSEEGTRLVKDVFPGPEESEPRILAATGDRIFFFARRGGEETWRTLWVSDGTDEGTRPVGEYELCDWDKRPPAVALKGLLFFPVDDYVHGCTLWISDGTREGTKPVAELDPEVGGWNPRFLTAAGDRVFFTAYGPGFGEDLWVSDGTPQGTRLVRAAPEEEGPVQAVVAVGDRAFFAIWEPVAELEAVWVSDGSAEGTQLLKYARRRPSADRPWDLARAGDRVYFLSWDPERGWELWVSDGTRAGTQLAKVLGDASPGGAWDRPVSLRDRLVFAFVRPDGAQELWISDGTEAGTARIRRFEFGSELSRYMYLTAAQDQVFFQGWDPIHSWELWASDGTEAGTRLVKDIRPGTRGSGVANLISASGRLFFQITNAEYQTELWVSDGTEEGTQILRSAVPGREGSSFEPLAVAGDRLFLRTEFAPYLWVSDGTPAGTVPLRGAQGDADWRFPKSAVGVGDRLFFVVQRGQGASAVKQLWALEVGEDTPWLVADVEVVLRVAGTPEWDAAGAGDRLFFAVRDQAFGEEPWVSDGSPQGTFLLKDISPGSGSSNPRSFTRAGERVFFTASQPDIGRGLWASDGTPAGTLPLKVPIRPGADVFTEGVPNLAALGDRVLFAGSDPDHGLELWISDGTERGTRLLKDIAPGPENSEPWGFFSAGTRVFFTVPDAPWSCQLWVSDGTEEGTRPLTDPTTVLPSLPYAFYGASRDPSGWALFTAWHSDYGAEPWSSDGTPEGTQLLWDLVPGTSGSAPTEYAVVGDLLFFNAQSPEYGRELWVAPFALPRAFHRGDANADGRLEITDAIFLLMHLFRGGEAPPCEEAANANDDRTLDIADAIYVLNHLFRGGPEPPPPGPPGSRCGLDPAGSPTNLGCEEYTSC